MEFHPVSDGDGAVIPLGRPIDNCYVAVLGPDGSPLPRGAVGELAIGGVCVGDGYYGDPDATARAFVPNRFPGRIPGDRLYLSGDLGYLDEEGRLFFSGRRDFQVKIGGVRVELGEIELAAQQCPGVRQAKALVTEHATGKSLALFAAGAGGLTDAVVRRLTAEGGVEVGVQDLLGHPTARQLELLIERLRCGAATEAETALMERDASAGAAARVRAADPAGPLRSVLVTGATGFVGSRLVHELLARTDVRVLCLARAADDAASTERVVTALAGRGLWERRFADRIEGYAGDLGRPELGLAAQTWEHLARACDLIVHSGALVNFLFDYRAHRSANVTGTAALLRLAMAHRPVPMHHISTLAALRDEATRRPGRLPRHHEPAPAEAPGRRYSRATWLAGRYLAQAPH